MNISDDRERLTVEAIRVLGVPLTLISDFELTGALQRDRGQAPERDFGGEFPDAIYDRRGLLNVLAWLAQTRAPDADAQQLAAVREAINTRDQPSRTDSEIGALVPAALEDQ